MVTPGLLEPDPAQGDGFDKHAVETAWRAGEQDLGLDPGVAQRTFADERQRTTAYLRKGNTQPHGYDDRA